MTRPITLNPSSMRALERCDKYYSEIVTLKDERAPAERIGLLEMHYEHWLQQLHVELCRQRGSVLKPLQDEPAGELE